MKHSSCLTGLDHLLHTQPHPGYHQQADTAVDRRSATPAGSTGIPIAGIVTLIVAVIKNVLDEVFDPIDQTTVFAALIVVPAAAGTGECAGTSQYQQAEHHHE